MNMSMTSVSSIAQKIDQAEREIAERRAALLELGDPFAAREAANTRLLALKVFRSEVAEFVDEVEREIRRARDVFERSVSAAQIAAEKKRLLEVEIAGLDRRMARLKRGE